MFPRVKRVRHMGEYRLELSFTDDTTKELDFKDRIVGRGGVFRSMEDVEFFKQVRVDCEAGTIVWPNGIDFCPDVLYSLATGNRFQFLSQFERSQKPGGGCTSRPCPIQHPRKSNRFPDMLEATHPCHEALHTHSEAAVRDRAVFAEVDVPLEGFAR
jgi:Protein of unknown function (DUF2442)